MTKALSPQDLKTSLEEGAHIPNEIIEVINKLLIQSGSSSPTLLLKDVKRAISEKVGSSTFPKQWLDFEPVFRARGWRVVYDSPGYNESHYDAFYSFTPL